MSQLQYDLDPATQFENLLLLITSRPGQFLSSCSQRFCKQKKVHRVFVCIREWHWQWEGNHSLVKQVSVCKELPPKPDNIEELKFNVYLLHQEVKMSIDTSGRRHWEILLDKGNLIILQSNALSMKWNKIWCKTNCLFNSLQWFIYLCDTKRDVIVLCMRASWSEADMINRPPLYNPWIDGENRIKMKRGWTEPWESPYYWDGSSLRKCHAKNESLKPKEITQK